MTEPAPVDMPFDIALDSAKGALREEVAWDLQDLRLRRGFDEGDILAVKSAVARCALPLHNASRCSLARSLSLSLSHSLSLTRSVA